MVCFDNAVCRAAEAPPPEGAPMAAGDVTDLPAITSGHWCSLGGRGLGNVKTQPNAIIQTTI